MHAGHTRSTWNVRPFVALGFAATLGWGAPAAIADTFELKSGGTLQGELANPDQQPRRVYEIHTDTGARLTLAAGLIARHVPVTPEDKEYAKRRSSTPDTVEGHWQLALWCLEHGQLSARRTHLRRILELDPDHAEARRILGYRRVGQQWMTRDDVMQQRGYVLYQGDWRTPQDVAIRQRMQQREQAEKDWKRKLRRLLSRLNDPRRAEEANDEIRNIKDPLATPALVEALADERNYLVRRLLMDVLAGQTTGFAREALVRLAVEDANQEIRARALEHLRDDPYNVRVTSKLLGYLKSNQNIAVNRAAYVLGELGNTPVVTDLIEALVTKHKIQLPSQPSISATSSPGRGSSFGFGGGGPRQVAVPQKNPEVRSALVKLTGQSFDYNKAAWKAWYVASRRVENVDLRRDE